MCFWHEHRRYLIGSATKSMTVAKNLPEAQPKLAFFVLLGRALDLCDEKSSFTCPCEVEGWIG